jgi:uncharacterized membrane protein
MRPNAVYGVIALLSVIAIAFSAILLVEKTQNNQALNNICGALNGQCEQVQGSPYGQTFGINNPIIGIAAFTLLLILALVQLARSIRLVEYSVLFGCVVAGIVSLRFLYLQEFVLHMYCAFCLVVDGISLALMILALIRVFRKKKALEGTTN